MAKERIEKTLIILDEDEMRQVMRLARQNDLEAIYSFMRDVIAKKVEAALRMRCS
jgi:hypothetical protein